MKVLLWRCRAILCISALYISFPIFAYAQTLPGNFNLVANGGFDFRAGLYYNSKDYHTFANNPTCWISANKADGIFQLVEYYFPKLNFHARSGKIGFLLVRGYSYLNLTQNLQ